MAAYDRLISLVRFLGTYRLVRFDEASADQFDRLRKSLSRVGSQDLKIASVVLVHDATLLSSNLRDFRQVAGLRVENWLA